MFKWVKRIWDGVDRELYNEAIERISKQLGVIEDLQEVIRPLEHELKEAKEALNYLPKRFIREMGRDYESDPPLWMPVGIGLDAAIEPRPSSPLDVFTLEFDCRLAINMVLDNNYPVGEAGFMVDKMSKQIASAVQHELAAKGMVQLSRYLQKKDREHAA